MKPYLYHPEYSSFFCDDEQTAVGLRDKKLVFIDESIAHHHHPAWLGGMRVDDTYRKNHPFWEKDKATFHKRKSLGFPK